jgi:hypothetical protein
MARGMNFLISLDQFLFSVLTLGYAAPDETASAAAWRLEQAGKWQGKVFRPFIDTLFFKDDNHCLNSFKSEQNRNQLPDAYRSK